MAIDKVKSECIPLYQEFGPQFVRLAKNLPREAIQHLSTFCEKSVPDDLLDQMGRSALLRAAEIMDLMVIVPHVLHWLSFVVVGLYLLRSMM